MTTFKLGGNFSDYYGFQPGQLVKCKFNGAFFKGNKRIEVNTNDVFMFVEHVKVDCPALISYKVLFKGEICSVHLDFEEGSIPFDDLFEVC